MEDADAGAAAFDAQLLASVAKKEADVAPLIKAPANLKQALKIVLAEPPVSTKEESIKARAAAVVFNVILAFKDDQALIQAALNELSQDELDTLMKYVYRGLNSRIEAATQLLKWHDKVVKKAGVGVIVRSLTARQTV